MKQDIDFNPSNTLPPAVMDLFAIKLDGAGRDQHGLRWKDAAYGPLSPAAQSIATMAGAVLANPKNLEGEAWTAFPDSMQDPLVCFIARQRGQHPHPAMRIQETREYFDAVIRCPLGMVHPYLRAQVKRANDRHVAYGVRDRETNQVFPQLQRSFKFVTELFVNAFQRGLRKGGSIAAQTSSAVKGLFDGADVRLGMPLTPVSTQDFLRVHEDIIGKARDLLARQDPALLRSLDDAARRVTSNTLKVASDARHVPVADLVQELRPGLRRILAAEAA